jgi:predicted transcriptional regulator
MPQRPGSLNDKHRRAIELVSIGTSHVEIAKELGVNEATVSTWFSLPEFQEEIAKLNRQSQMSMMAHINKLGARASKLYSEVLDNPEASTRDRLAAAKQVTDLIFRYTEMVTYEELQELKQAIETLKETGQL